MPNVLVALPNIGDALCLTRGKKERKKKRIEITGQKYNGLPYLHRATIISYDNFVFQIITVAEYYLLHGRGCIRA